MSDYWKRHEAKMYSQNGEDGVIWHLLSQIKGVLPYAVEIGVNEQGKCLEGNTISLFDTRGWWGLLIDKKIFAMPSYQGVRGVCRHMTTANFACTLDICLVPYHFGILSIDVDGMDYWLWRSLQNTPWRPSVVVIEYNADLPPDHRMTVPYDPDFEWSGSNYYGASAAAMVDIGHQMGYRLVTDVAHVNLVFAHTKQIPQDWEEPDLASLGGMVGRQYPTDTRKWMNLDA
jgi:hypothetical protein